MLILHHALHDIIKSAFNLFRILYYVLCLTLCGMAEKNMAYVIDYNVLIKHLNVAMLLFDGCDVHLPKKQNTGPNF